MKKQQKLKYRFNIVDVLLILVVIAIVFVVYYFVAGRNGGGSQNENTIHYTIELKTVDKDYLDNITVGDKVIETVRNRTVGKVVDVEIGPSWTHTTNMETGEITKRYYPPVNLQDNDEALDEAPLDEELVTPSDEDNENVENEQDTPDPIYDYYNVRLTVEADADYTGAAYSIGGYDIVVGQMVYFRIPKFSSAGYCVALEVIE